MMTLQIHTGGINLKKKNIYSIRKLGVGIASVTLGTLLISGGVTPAAWWRNTCCKCCATR